MTGIDIDIYFSIKLSVTFVTRKRKQPTCFGDFREEDLNSPKKARIMWEMATAQIQKKNKMIKVLRLRNKRLTCKVSTLSNLLEHLKN